MTIDYRITIDGTTHEVRVALPEQPSEDDLEEARDFAVSTAFLEHFGYLPRGVVNAVA
jgi:hypothetical protein